MNISKSSINTKTRSRSSRDQDELTDDHAHVNFPPPLIHFVGIMSGFAMNEIYPLQTPRGWGFGGWEWVWLELP